MMIRPRSGGWLFLFAWLFLLGSARAVDDPQGLVQHTTDQVISLLKGQQDTLKGQSNRIYGVIENQVLPHFDFERMASWVLGPNWRTISAIQQQRFVEEFRNLLVRTYGVALLEYTDYAVNYLPTRGNPEQGEATVRTQVRRTGGQAHNIDYTLGLKDGQWKVYDVVIDGASLVTTYRSSFATEVRNGGIDGLIAQLASRNQQNREGAKP